jgi:trimeric autotransporter adhesin
MGVLLTASLWSSLLHGVLFVITGVDSLIATQISVTVNASIAPPPAEVSAFVQSLGVNTHLGYPGTPYYSSSQNVIAAVQYLGINTVRDQSPTSTNNAIISATNNALAAAGVKFDVLLPGNGYVNLTGDLAAIDAFQRAYPGVVAAIEGPNEINAWPVSYQGIADTYSAGIQLTQDLWAAVQADSLLSAVPVYALTLSTGMPNVPGAEAKLGNLAPYVTYGNAHIYAAASNNVWQYDMPSWLPIFELVTPGKPMVITETGYVTIPSQVDEVAAAKYSLNTFFENAQNGIVGTYSYELVDTASSPADKNPEDNYGQFHRDWTPKAGATAIHNMTAILQGAGDGMAVSALNYSVSGLPPTGHAFLLGGSDAYDLAVWIDATIYNPATATDIVAPVYSATINLGGTFAGVQVFDPMIGTMPIATYTNVSQFQISVSDHPLIVQIN